MGADAFTGEVMVVKALFYAPFDKGIIQVDCVSEAQDDYDRAAINRAEARARRQTSAP